MPRYYYGWNIVGIAVLGNMLVVGCTFSSFGLFVVPVSKDLGLSRADMNTALILTNVGTALMAPFIGRILDRFPVRRTFIACSVFLGLGLIALGLSRSLWLSAAVMAVPLGAAMLGAGAMAYSVLIARWFLAQRGRAMALSAVGMSLGHVAIVPIMGWLIATQGWRHALVFAGAGVLVILLTLSLFLRERPGPEDVEPGRAAAGAAPKRDGPPEPPAKVGTIVSMPQFWFMGLGAALGMAIAQGVLVTLVPLATDGGLSIIEATTLMSVAGASAIAGKLLLAVIADKVDRLLLFTGFLILGAVMNLGLLISEGYPFLLGCAVMLGLTTAALAPIFYTLLADRFGAPSFGTVRGLTAPLTSILGAAAVRISGEVYDRTGGYDALFALFIGLQLVAAALMFATRFTRPLAPAASPAAA